jgi:hypothetical protein
MSTDDTHGHAGNNGRPVHKDVSFEPRDVRTSPILRFLVYLGIVIVLSYVVTLGIYRGLNHFWTNEYPPPMPSRMAAGPSMPPEPRLQGMPGHLTDPQQDLRDKIKADTEANEKLEWIDQKAGVAQIPVSDAMQLVVQKGLPAVAPPPAEKK